MELSADAQISDKINSLQSYLLSLLSEQQKIHRLREIISLGERRFQATAIYLGTFNGYFISDDQQTCGRLSLTDGKWQAVEDKALRPALVLALAQLERNSVPQLVKLPIVGGKE